MLKVDIEGAEVELLEAMLATDTLDRCKSIFVETHETSIPALEDRIARLRTVAESGEYREKLFFDWR